VDALRREVLLLQDKLSSLTRDYRAGIDGGGGEGKQHGKQQGRSLPRPNPLFRRHHPLSPYGHHVHETTGGVGMGGGGGEGGSGRRQIRSFRARMGRNASVATAAVLDALPDEPGGGGGGGGGGDEGGAPTASSSVSGGLVHRITEMFKDPASHLPYLNSDRFARDVLKLCGRVRPILEAEPRVAFLQSPVYVFGDLHGNLEDLHFFSDNVWRLGMSLTAGNFLFLGDYVDRGMSCLEVVSYLLVMKLSLPHKVYLLRGNHETRDVNGWEEHYGERSFLFQCRDRFGDELGYRVWESCNRTFDRMPLAAVVDQDIFCVHGGIPRPIGSSGRGGGAGGSPPPSGGALEEVDTDTDDDGEEGGSVQGGLGRGPEAAAVPSGGGGGGGSGPGSRLQDILSVPHVAGINPPFEHEDEDHQQVASDCIWSDPASDEQERSGVDPGTGFGDSLRGGGAICFGHRAVTDFLRQQGLSYIMRAHEAHAEGVAVSKGARVFTVFSTSKDHNQGSEAMAGCILVDFERMQVINRSPAYRNQYVHRRDSISLSRLSEGEIEQRIKLGLVTPELGREDGREDQDGMYDDEGEDYEEETWEDLEDEEEEIEEEGEDDFVDDEVDLQVVGGGRGSDPGPGPIPGEGRRRSRSGDSAGSPKRRSSVDPHGTCASPAGGSHDNHAWGEGPEQARERSGSNSSSSSVGSFDYANGALRGGLQRPPLGGFTSIQEEDEDGEDGDEESTVDGRGAEPSSSAIDTMDCEEEELPAGMESASRGGGRGRGDVVRRSRATY
jgi:hypothetical protein